MKVSVDIETRSRVNLVKQGVYKYAEDPSTEVLVICYRVENGPVQTWKLWDPDTKVLDEFIALLSVSSVDLHAHNANFERVILSGRPGRRLGLPVTPPGRWRCTAVKCALHGLPRDLKNAAKILGGHPKDESGRRVMMKLSKPRPRPNDDRYYEYEDCPDDFEHLARYCEDDVLAEYGIDEKLPKLPAKEQAYWELDQEINDRGIRVDTDLALLMVDTWKVRKEKLNQRCIEITGAKTTQVKDLVEYLGIKDLTKGTLENLDLDKMTERQREVVKLRQEAGMTSISKYDALLRMACEDGRLRGMFLHHGAQTGRWAGRGVQLHNLPRNASKDPQALVDQLFADPGILDGDIAQQLIRPSFTCDEDKHLLVYDWSGIELRLSLWFVDDEVGLDKIRSGIDMYVDMATFIFNKPHDEIDDVERFIGKQAVLGLGYGMGAKGFRIYCKGFGRDIPMDLCEHTVATYRDLYERIYKGGTKLMYAATNAIRNPGKVFTALGGKIKYTVRGSFLYCVLPSGRPITYPFPEVHMVPTPWGSERPTPTYMGINPYSRRWARQDTFGGRLMENICQGAAACVLRESILNLDTAGYNIVAHVHDEVLCEGLPGQAERMAEIMSQSPDWAETLPLAVEGKAIKRYQKL